MKKQKLFLLALFTMIWPALSILNCQLSILKAQTFVIVDKNGNRTTYDVSKLDSVTFQQTPPGFTVYEEASPSPSESGETPAEPTQETTTYTFDAVQSLAGDPDFLFSHPDTMYIGADGQDFKFQLRTNVDYGYKPSADWLRFKADYEDADSLSFTAMMNPSTRQRIGYLYFQSNDAKMRDTLVVVQFGKRDSRYIDIDWSKTTLDSYNKETGRAVLTFQDDVPVMGDHDVMLLPGTETYSIRIIDDVQQAEGSKTVTLDTREGKMGNLFKDQQFTLCSDPNYDPSESSSEGGTTKPSYAPSITGPIIYPETIELCENGRPVMEVYNRRSQLEKEYNIFEYKYDNSGETIWEKGANKVSWNTCTFDVGLKGIFAFDFGDTEWENVRFGDLQNFKAYLDGDFNTELILQYELTKGVEAKYEKTLKKDIFSYRVKFMVGTIPVWINLKSDLKASVEAKAEGTVAVTGGVRASANLKGGVEWDTNRGVNPISSFDYQYELVSPEVTAEAHAEAKAYVWPEINIGIYDVLCPTINPKPYIRAYADARTAEANKPFFGWNAGVSTGVDLTLGLNLDLYFWKKEIGEIDPINLIDRDLVAVPTKIELEGDTISRVLKGTTHEVKYKVKGYNSITGSEYLIPGALVKIESLGGGEIDSEQWKGSDYFYSNWDGEVIVKYTQTDSIPGYLKATLITGDEERDAECRNWRSEVVDFRFTAVAEANSISATRAGKAEAEFLLEEWTKSKADENGRWQEAYGYKVGFSATGGRLDADTLITNEMGTVIVNFDGGEGFSGGSLTAEAIVQEFDTKYTQTLNIYKFSFDDPHLARAYNLPNNTVWFDGGTLPIVERTIIPNYIDKPADARANAPKRAAGAFPHFYIDLKAEEVYNTTVGKFWMHTNKTIRTTFSIEPEIIFNREDPYDYDHPYDGKASNYDTRQGGDGWFQFWDVSLEGTEYDTYNDIPMPSSFNSWHNYFAAYVGVPNVVEYEGHSGVHYGWNFFFDTYPGKQFIFEEGNTYVFLYYRAGSNGDRIYIKSVWKKSEIWP